MAASLLLEEVFKVENWRKAIEKGEMKDIDPSILQRLCSPSARQYIYEMIVNDKYTMMPPHMAQIPKNDGTGDMRTVYVNEPIDRIIASIINDALFKLLGKDMVHKNCVSYQKGIGTGKIVKKCSEILAKNKKHVLGAKYDFHHYFDTVNKETVYKTFDEIERRLGERVRTDPIINALRRTWGNDTVISLDKREVQQWSGIRQGNAVSAFLANVVLYDLDDYMSKHYDFYCRYSDDLIVLTDDPDRATEDIMRIVQPKGVELNLKKTEILTKNRWFKFLGYSLKDNEITLSKKRIRDFSKEIRRRCKHGKSFKCALNDVNRYLYIGNGEHSWATQCLGVINVEKDINTLNEFVMDALRSTMTDRHHIGGLGYENRYPDHVITRGRGKNVGSNRERTEKEIEGYYSLMCMRNNLIHNRDAYEAVCMTL